MELQGHPRVRGPRQEQPQRQTRGGRGDTETGVGQPPLSAPSEPSQKVCAPRRPGTQCQTGGVGGEAGGEADGAQAHEGGAVRTPVADSG